MGVAVNWGAWAGAGMAARAGIERMERLGFGGIQPLAGMSALSAILAAPQAPQTMGSVFFWDRYAFYRWSSSCVLSKEEC